MRCTVSVALVAVLAAIPPIAMAQASAPEQGHARITPGASAPAPTPKAPNKHSPKVSSSAATMKSMQEMHTKMMAAKTVEERQALMGEHMKAMQDGMTMMGQMKSGKGGMSPDAMAKRMDMMEMMMQMMMDREGMRPPATK